MPTSTTRKVQPSKQPGAPTIGILGGSGLYEMPGLTAVRELRVRTPFGAPSDALVAGTLQGRRVVFLARHGRGHRILPGEINYRANIYSMKLLGVERILSVSAVGSLREDLQPGHFLVPDQFFDRTRHRVDTFFGGGLVAHISFDKPTCRELSGWLGDACESAGVKVHRGGTYVCIEGPQFSTLAESHVYRQIRFDVIGMTNLTEARLAREAEICYATVAMITDYDCWHPGHDSVTGAEIMACLSRNAENAQSVIRHAVGALPAVRDCKCAGTLAHALITDRKLVPAAARRRLAAIVGKYFSRKG
jgi:5'-methylthioadenosine phosphorylase